MTDVKAYRSRPLTVESDWCGRRVVANSEKQFDCKMTIDLYRSIDGIIVKLDSGGDSVYDIVAPACFSDREHSPAAKGLL